MREDVREVGELEARFEQRRVGQLQLVSGRDELGRRALLDPPLGAEISRRRLAHPSSGRWRRSRLGEGQPFLLAGQRGAMDEFVRAVLANALRQLEHDPLGVDVAALGVDVRAHALVVDLEPVEQLGAERERHGGGAARLGQERPLGLPRGAVALVLADQTFEREARRPRATTRASVDEVLGALRVALLRHRDAADHALGRRLGQLADLGPLEVVDLVADPRQRAR